MFRKLRKEQSSFFTDNSCRYVEIYFLNGIKFIEEPLSKIKLELGIVLFLGGMVVDGFLAYSEAVPPSSPA